MPRTGHSLGIAAAAAGFFLAGAGIATATVARSHAPTDAVACVNPHGYLVIAQNRRGGAGLTQVSLPFSTVRGATGPRGPAGKAGPAGNSGQGGNSGQDGTSGPAGNSDPGGNSGQDGNTGPTGNTGPAGSKGPVGPAGAVGAIGPKGVTGASGVNGSKGVTGPTGPAGLSSVFGTNSLGFFEGSGGTATCTLGSVILSASIAYPENYLPAAGQIMQIAQNTALFSLLGTNYGGNGTTTYALPNLVSAAPNDLQYLMRRLRELPGHSFVVAGHREHLRSQSSLVTASPKRALGC